MARRVMSRMRATPANGPGLVLLSGVLFSFGPILYRSTSLYKDAGAAGDTHAPPSQLACSCAC